MELFGQVHVNFDSTRGWNRDCLLGSGTGAIHHRAYEAVFTSRVYGLRLVSGGSGDCFVIGSSGATRRGRVRAYFRFITCQVLGLFGAFFQRSVSTINSQTALGAGVGRDRGIS
jgi:hypothetical protein